MKSSLITILMLTSPLVITANSWSVDKTETIERTIEIPSPVKHLLIVDNIWGGVSVRGDGGKTIRAVIKKQVLARDETCLDKANHDIVLDISEDEHITEFYVDGPFRKRNSRWRGCKRSGYEVRYDFEITIPRAMNIEISTVNEGEITIHNVHGDYDVNHVNGPITMDGLTGSGYVYSVNGHVTCRFDKNPTQKSEFGTLNDKLKLYFKSPLAADFYLKTFNGEVYSDFKLASLLTKPETKVKRNGRQVYTINRETAVRSGRGGPKISLNGFNGNMYILHH